MDRVFSVDDMGDRFWSPPPPVVLSGGASDNQTVSSSSSKMMNRSSSEWAFQRFLQEVHTNPTSNNIKKTSESSPPSSSSCGGAPARSDNDVIEIKDHPPQLQRQATTPATTASFNSAPPPNIPVDSDEYQEFLKRRLNLACAAVALTRASYVKPQESTAVANNGSQASSTSQLGSQAPGEGSGCGLSKGQGKDVGGPLGIPSLPVMQKKYVVPVRSTTSGSSRELSDDDEAEGETETTQNRGPADAKRFRSETNILCIGFPTDHGSFNNHLRMISNRESARRSRRRKQAHLTVLETQVSQLRVENSSLLKRLAEISQKYNESAVDNRVLKADVETLRAKVKMAEETVKRVTGLNPLFQAMSEISTGMPSFASSSPSDTSADAAVSAQQEDPKQQFYQSAPNNHMLSHDPRIHQNGFLDIASAADNVRPNPSTAAVFGNKMDRTASMQRVASLEHLQKRIRGGSSPSGASGDQ